MKLIKLFLAFLIVIFLINNFYAETTRFTRKVTKEDEDRFKEFRTPLEVRDVHLYNIIETGLKKDQIPALTNPVLIPINFSQYDDSTMGVLVNLNGEQRFYPFEVLAVHQIINDSISNTHYLVTYCPICASSTVYDREVSGGILEFRNSGKMYESNLVLFDTMTESLWAQAKGEGVVGDFTGTKLEILPFQIISFQDLKMKYPEAKVLGIFTGYNYNYSFDPFEDYFNDYLQTERTVYSVTYLDKRLPAKAVMYVFYFDNKSIAFRKKDLDNGTIEKKIGDKIISIVRKGDEIKVYNNGKYIPGYLELWFAWVNYHQQDGLILDIK